MDHWPLAISIVILAILIYIYRNRESENLKKPDFTDDPIEYWAIDKNADELNPIKCDFYLLVKKKTHERVAIIWNKKRLDLSENDLLLETEEAYTGRFKGKTIDLKKFELKKDTDIEDLDEEEKEKAVEIPDWIIDSVIPAFELNEIQKRKIWNPRGRKL